MSDWKNHLHLQKYQQSDLPFLFQLYASTRSEELKHAPFSKEEKIAFLQQQFAAQTQHYTTHYNTDFFDVILLDQKPVGRLYIDYWSDQIRIVDISLLPDHQNQKIGTYLLQQLFQKSRNQQKPVSIHVERFNPARLWYERLGFKYKTSTNEIYLLMERSADPL